MLNESKSNLTAYILIIPPSNDFYETGIDKVEVKIKRALAPGGGLFSRLRVKITP